MPPSVSEGKDKPIVVQRGGFAELPIIRFHQLSVNSHAAQCGELSLHTQGGEECAGQLQIVGEGVDF